MKEHKGVKITLIVLVSVIILALGSFLIYANDYYEVSETVAEEIKVFEGTIRTESKLTMIEPRVEDDDAIGFIFYPGGKVEAEAYMPLLMDLSDEGVTVVLVEMPFNLAVFNINAADQVYDYYPEIESWFIGGHSLGGAMASSYVEGHEDLLDGLILLGAYPVNDSEIETLVVYGTEDLALNKEEIAKVENPMVLEGGNHAQFGDYGHQEGDGIASISREVQQAVTVDAIVSFMD